MFAGSRARSLGLICAALLAMAPALSAQEIEEDEEWLEHLWDKGYSDYHFKGVEASGSGSYPRYRLGLLADLRFFASDGPVGWLDGDLGKTRYGTSGDHDHKESLRLSALYGSLAAKLHPDVGGYARFAFDAEPDPDQPRSRGEQVDLIEGFLSYEPPLTRTVQLKSKAGIFFPELSLENRGPDWTPLYTITPSAINSWIGDEVRIIGLDAKLEYTYLTRLFSAGAGVFKYNDPNGALLAWRGWALGDRQTGYMDRLPFDDIPLISSGGFLERQVDWSEPFVEIDDRAGFYAAASLADRRYVSLHFMHYDNHADPSQFDGRQYAWATRFNHFGMEVPFSGSFEILGQALEGSSKMGENSFGPSVAIDFRSVYALASYRHGSGRLSLRYDRFEVDDRDIFRAEDDNREDGYAWTLAYLYDLAPSHRLGAEVLRVRSDREGRAAVGLDPSVQETLFQTSYRYNF